MNKGEETSIQIRLRNAGFKEKDANSDDNCLFCNYYHLTDGDRIPVCELLGIKFGDDFSPENYICGKFDGSIFDNLIEKIKKEEAEKTQSNRKSEEIKQKDGKVGRILGRITAKIRNKFE